MPRRSSRRSCSSSPARRPGPERASRPRQEDDARSADLRTIAAVPAARSSTGDADQRPAPRRDARRASTRIPPSRPSVAPTGPREVRHVAIVTLHLDGVIEGPVAERALENLRTVLNEIAYKRNMQVGLVDARRRARRRRRLGPRSARRGRRRVARARHPRGHRGHEGRPAHAGRRGDRHRARHRVGLARPARGTSSATGCTIRRASSPTRSPTQTPLHRTWVAGGVYRLVRREFRWGDAPTLKLERPQGARRAPDDAHLRARAEPVARGAARATSRAAASDLVGRDAEKADLHAAYHEAVNGNGGGGRLVTPRAIVGELGIGKTALVATFLAELPPNARLIRVECSPVKQEVPFSATAELVRDAIGTTGEEPFEEVAQLIARAGGGRGAGGRVEPDGRAPRGARDEPPDRARRRRGRALPEEAGRRAASARCSPRSRCSSRSWSSSTACSGPTSRASSCSSR